MRLRAVVFAIAVFVVAMPSQAYRMSAWVPSWDSKALASMQLNAGKLNEANPGWYTIAADGGVTKNYKSEDPTLRAALTGVDLLPTIKNYVNDRFDGALVARVIGAADTRERHAETLTQLVVTNAFAGIDIDYESLPGTARADFSTFIQILANKLHSAGKKLSVTVHAKTTDAGEWSGPASQDWRALGSAADSVKIMAYDNHYSGSTAGAISPLDWLDAIASYAESVVASQKVVIGLPWYGYDWLGKSATGVVYSEAVALAQKNNAPITRDANGEATFSYSGRTVFFQDATSYARKIDAIVKRHPGIGGFAHWRAGGEDPAIWSDVARLHSASSPIPALPSPGNFVINGPASLSMKAGQQTAASYAVVPVDGFNDATSVSVQQIDAFPGTLAITQSARVASPATLTIAAGTNATAGTYRVRVRMTSGALVSDLIVSVKVDALTLAKRRSARH